MGNKYIKKFRNSINSSKSDNDIDIVLERIYSDGFEDGCNKED